MRSLGVTSKSCSCAGTLPVSGRSECHCMALTFSPLMASAGMVPAGSAALRGRRLDAERGQRARAGDAADELAAGDSESSMAASSRDSVPKFTR